MTQEHVIWPGAGRYLLAVSGGADSMVLLDIFACSAKQRGYELVVAHFDHGMRTDSKLDRQFVQAATESYSLPFVHATARLNYASEATARSARHTWLAVQRDRMSALAILTAHHQDDLLETSLLNLARGTGRLGLAPMAPTATILRPLLALDRTQLRDYAAEHNIGWHEDSTNADTANPRNFLRLELLTRASPIWRQRYLVLITSLANLNNKVDQSISDILAPAYVNQDVYSFSRELVRSRSDQATQEVLLAAARRLRPGIQIDQRLIQEIAHFAKTGYSGKLRPMRQGLTLSITKDTVNLTTKSPH